MKSSRLIRGLVVLLASAVGAIATPSVKAQAVASDRMLIALPGPGAILFDNSIAEPPATGVEATLTFAGGPTPVPPPIPPATAVMLKGAGIVALYETRWRTIRAGRDPDHNSGAERTYHSQRRCDLNACDSCRGAAIYHAGFRRRSGFRADRHGAADFARRHLSSGDRAAPGLRRIPRPRGQPARPAHRGGRI